MSSKRRAAVLFVRALFAAAIAFEIAATHFPAPSRVAPESADEVRGAWSAVGSVGRAGAAYAPDFVGPMIRPLASDKTLHFLLFFPLGLLLGIERRLLEKLDSRTAVIVFGVLAVYAGVGEASQELTGRFAELGDWIANCLGAGVGLGLVFLLTRSWRTPAVAPTPGTRERV